MDYIREQSKVIYKLKNGNDPKEFDAVDFIACLVSHIPNKCEQLVRHNGYLQQCLINTSTKKILPIKIFEI